MAAKNRCKFAIGKNHAKKALKNLIWGRLGLHLAGFGGGFGKGLEALGAFGVVLETLFFMLVCGVVFKSALGAVWLGFWFDFNGFWEDFGRVLEGFGRVWEEFASILGDSGPLWTILGCWGVLGRFSQDFGWCSLLQWNSF